MALDLDWPDFSGDSDVDGLARNNEVVEPTPVVLNGGDESMGQQKNEAVVSSRAEDNYPIGAACTFQEFVDSGQREDRAIRPRIFAQR